MALILLYLHCDLKSAMLNVVKFITGKYNYKNLQYITYSILYSTLAYYIFLTMNQKRAKPNTDIHGSARSLMQYLGGVLEISREDDYRRYDRDVK